VEGRAKPRTLEEWPKGHPRRVSWNFTHAMGVPVERGRAFTARDTAGQPLVMLINRDAADLYWPGLDPIGRRIALPFTNEWRTIVGITGNIRHLGLAKGDAPEIYFPLAQWAEPGMDLTLIVRTEGDPLRLAEPLRREIAALDPDLPVSGISTVASRIEQQASEPRFNSLLFGILAGLAISLSAIGLYSLLAYLVAQRTAEIGLRMALGARPGNVLRAVVRDGMQWTLAGIVAGIAAALALGRWLQPLLFGISTGDPWVYAGAATVLAAVALLACLVPALRASRVDPAIALRSE
jgi:putative ABC transport system permease protein